MTVKTRYFVIASLLVVTVGLGTGLVAYVEVREIMASDLRQKLHEGIQRQAQEDGRREFQELTGINFETDIERAVGCFDSQSSGGNSGLVLARGLFDSVKIEALMRE